jgi:hypothetical protein
MRRATWFFAVVLGLVVLASCVGPAVQEALPEGTVELSAVTTSLDQVGANGEIVSYGGCGWESIWFSAVEATHDDGFGKKTNERYVSLQRYAHDWCTGAYEGHWGVVPLDASAMMVRGNLGSGELRVDAELTEGYSDGGSVHVVMDLILVGTGDLQTTRTKQQSDEGDGKVHTQTTSEYRQAEISGTIMVRGVPVNLDDASSRSGELWSMTTKTTYTGEKAPKPSKEASIMYFYAWPDQIRDGEPTYLEWQVTGRDPITLTIEPDVGDVSGTNSVTVWPTETTTYTLTAHNRWGEASAWATVTVMPRPVPDELEPNDTRADATEIELDYLSPVLTITVGDVDWFVFTSAAPTTVIVDVDAAVLGSPLDSYIGVFDSDGWLVDANDDADGWLDSYLKVALDAGTFFVAVTGWPDTPFEGQHWTEGLYRLTVSAVVPLADDELEPNDDRASATPIPFGYGSPELTITPGDIDWFVFTLDAATTVAIDVDAENVGSTLDAVLGLFDVDGNQLAYVNDAGGSYDPHIGLYLEPATYYVAVSGWCDSDFVGGHAQEGTYFLRLGDVGPPPPDVNEPNDGPSQATPVTLNYDDADLTIDEGDVDWFTFTLVESANVVINVDAWAMGSSLDPFAGLFDENLDRRADSDNVDGLDPYIQDWLTVGTYFVAITGTGDEFFDGSHDRLGVYYLMIEIVP